MTSDMIRVLQQRIWIRNQTIDVTFNHKIGENVDGVHGSARSIIH